MYSHFQTFSHPNPAKHQNWNPGYGPKNTEGQTPRPMPRWIRTPQLPPENQIPRPTPRHPRWLGNWKPREIKTAEVMGNLAGEEISFVPLTAPTLTSSTPSITIPRLTAEEPSAWSSLWSGLANIITPAATAYAQTRTNSALLQAQQRAAAQTWNPAITGPAIAAQSWEQAYTAGAGIAPMGSMGTLALAAAGVLVVVLLARKK